MNEQVLRFGPDDQLIGILNRPREVVDDAPVAVILNAGIVHRVGPFRLHVDLARALAQKGFASVRLDLSGLGDSPVRTSVPEGKDRAELDVRDVMDSLQQSLLVERFVPLGLCSGAYNAHQIAIADNRVAGAVFFDGIVYETPEHRRRKRQEKLGSRFLRNAIKKRVAADIIPSQGGSGIDSAEFFTNDKPASEVADEIRSMLARQMQLLFLYTQGYQEISSADQFGEMFGIEPDDQQLQVDYYSNYEHTFRLTEHRSTVVERVSTWFANRFESRQPMSAI